MAIKVDFSRDLLAASIAEGRIVRAVCKCQGVGSWLLVSKDIGKTCTGCNEQFEILADETLEALKAS